MKARTMSRNSSCSWVKICRCIDFDLHPNRTPNLLRSNSFESSVSGMSDEAGARRDDAEAEKPENSVEPGMPGNPVRLTDPKMMRALAHPARIAIWSHIALRGSVTATECAEVAGLSPSACSYHLRTLAKYGFIEEDRASAANGRERPWRARLIAVSVGGGADSPPAVWAGGQPASGGEPAGFGRGGPRPLPGPPVRVSGGLAASLGRDVQRGARDAG